jgi:hypothetical protein
MEKWLQGNVSLDLEHLLRRSNVMESEGARRGRRAARASTLAASLLDNEALPITTMVPKSMQSATDMHHVECSKALEVCCATVAQRAVTHDMNYENGCLILAIFSCMLRQDLATVWVDGQKTARRCAQANSAAIMHRATSSDAMAANSEECLVACVASTAASHIPIAARSEDVVSII